MSDNPLVPVSIPHICYHLKAELSLKWIQTHAIDAQAQSQPDDISDEPKSPPRILEKDLYRLIFEEATEKFRKQEGDDALYCRSYHVHYREYHIHL